MVPMTEATRIGQEVGVRLLGDEAGHHGCEARVPNTSSSHSTQKWKQAYPRKEREEPTVLTYAIHLRHKQSEQKFSGLRHGVGNQ